MREAAISHERPKAVSILYLLQEETVNLFLHGLEEYVSAALVALAGTAKSGCQSRQHPDLEVSWAVALHPPLEIMAAPVHHRNNVRNNPTWITMWAAGSDRCLQISLLVLETFDATS